MKKQFYYSSIYNKSPVGACKQNQNVGYELTIAKDVSLQKVFLVIKDDKTKKTEQHQMICISVGSEYNQYYVNLRYETTGHFWYHFAIQEQNKTYYLQKTPTYEVEPTDDLKHSFLQLVYTASHNTTKDQKNGIIYHVFVDRFHKIGEPTPHGDLVYHPNWNNPPMREVLPNGEVVNYECYGGNLQGIIQKLPYLQKLNCKVLYLSPIFEANSSHKYDTADYEKIDPMFGTTQDLKQLIKQAKKLGIGVILDGVFNHTGSDSVYFNKLGRYPTLGAYQSQQSPYYSWYSFDNFPDKYASWWGINTLPQTNDTEPSYYNFIAGKNGILNRYMKLGLLGFRLDVVDELNAKFVTQIASAVYKSNKNALLVGEVWEDAAQKIAYGKRTEYFLGNQLNSVTNYPFKDGIVSFVKHNNLLPLLQAVYAVLDHYPNNAMHNLMNVLGTHDTARILSVLGGTNIGKLAEQKQNYVLTKNELQTGIHLLKMASVLQYTLPGMPCVFYGDEAGMQGLLDPYCRASYPWDNQNTELLDWYKQLGRLRLREEFATGETVLRETNNNVFVFKRKTSSSQTMVVINKSQTPYILTVHHTYQDFVTKQPLSGNITIEPNSFLILVR